MPTRFAVLPERPIRSGEIDTLGLSVKVVEVKKSYGDVAKVLVEGAAAELDKIPDAFAAFNAAEAAAYAAAEAARAAAKQAAAAAGG